MSNTNEQAQKQTQLQEQKTTVNFPLRAVSPEEIKMAMGDMMLYRMQLENKIRTVEEAFGKLLDENKRLQDALANR